MADTTMTDSIRDAAGATSRLTYVCEYCGRINNVSEAKCSRCGKRRPRNAYISAMKAAAEVGTEEYLDRHAGLSPASEDQQLVRLVESRVSEEKSYIMAQEAARLEQETDDIKRSTAREAALRIIAAEREADERIRAAELRADEAVSGRNRETEEYIAAERERMAYEASKRLVSERAGIENAAEDRIAAEKRSAEIRAQETIADAIDAAEQNMARRAVMKVVAAEQAAQDRSRLERDAIARAAYDRVAEERDIAEKNANARYLAEKEAIERAVDERIKAEREVLYGRRGGVMPAYGGMSSGGQPLAIVPYVSTSQPLYQYNSDKVVYKFVPDEEPVTSPAPKKGAPAAIAPAKGKKAKKKR